MKASYIILLLLLTLSLVFSFPSCNYDRENNEVKTVSSETLTYENVIQATLSIPCFTEKIDSNRALSGNTEEEPITKEKSPFKSMYKYVSDDEIIAMDTIIKDMKLMGQFPDYPTGCESVAAVNLMNYYGIDISVDEFIDEHLKKDLTFYYKDGKSYGPSPYEYFLGDPRTDKSWGCMSPVIVEAMKKSTDSAKGINNRSLEELCNEYVAYGNPVLVWVSIHMLDISYTSSWYLDEETLFSWPNNEHCMILIGYDDWYYYFNDPYVPAIVRYKKELAEDRFSTLGKQAIVIENK